MSSDGEGSEKVMSGVVKWEGYQVFERVRD